MYNVSQIILLLFEKYDIKLGNMLKFSLFSKSQVYNSKQQDHIQIKYKHAYENGYDGYMVTYRYM